MRTSGWMTRIGQFFIGHKSQTCLCRPALRKFWNIPESAMEVRLSIAARQTKWTVPVMVIFVCSRTPAVAVVIDDQYQTITDGLAEILTHYAGTTIHVQCEYR